MKILFLTPWYPDEKNPNHGIFVRDQAVAIQQVHQVCVVCAKIDYQKFGLSSFQRADSEFNGVEEHRIRVKQSLPVFNQINFFLIIVWQTWKIAREFKPDLIHGNIGYPGGFWSWCMSKILNKPFVITEHTRITNNFRSSTHKFLTSFSLKRAASIITVGKWQADEIFSLTDCQPIVIPNFVDFTKFKNIRPLPSSISVQMGFLGGLNSNVKGLDLLLTALAGISVDFTLHIGGTGTLLEQYKSLAKDLGISEKCVFYGFMPHDKIPEFMSRLHFFVSSSRSETFGLVMVEAMACGLPVVATRSGGTENFITTDTGVLTDVNYESLRKGISQMILDYNKYIPVKIREFVLGKFSPKNFVDSVNDVYSKILK
jgi:glycosyltransferase involved in cell wall biosynthesis